MKKLTAIFMSLLLLFVCTSCGKVEEDEELDVQTLTVEDPEYYAQLKGQDISINVYNWGEYISDGSDEGTLDVNKEFTDLTGIKVNYSTFATNEEMYAKIKGGASTYDVIIPSEYMISRMMDEGMLEKLDFSNIPNFKYIMPSFVNPDYDPENEYSVPYTWGTVGIIYDKTAVDEKDISWDILWDEKYKDRILMFDNPRDAFAVAELALGLSLNPTDPEEINLAAEKLKEQKSLVQAYVMDEIFDKMGAGEAALAPYYAGDAVTLMAEYDHLGFVQPKSGTNLFFDSMCIPKGSTQKKAAEMYINFMCEPDIAYATTSYIGYSTPNSVAYDMLDDEVKEDGISYLDDDYLNNKCETYINLPSDINQLMQDKWTEMKSSDDQNQNPFAVPIFMAICIGLSIGITAYRKYKKNEDIF